MPESRSAGLFFPIQTLSALDTTEKKKLIVIIIMPSIIIQGQFQGGTQQAVIAILCILNSSCDLLADTVILRYHCGPLIPRRPQLPSLLTGSPLLVPREG